MSEIKSVEELEELPEKAVITDRDNDAWQLRSDDLWYIAGDGEEPVDAYELFSSWSPLHLVTPIEQAEHMTKCVHDACPTTTPLPPRSSWVCSNHDITAGGSR